MCLLLWNDSDYNKCMWILRIFFYLCIYYRFFFFFLCLVILEVQKFSRIIFKQTKTNHWWILGKISKDSNICSMKCMHKHTHRQTARPFFRVCRRQKITAFSIAHCVRACVCVLLVIFCFLYILHSVELVYFISLLSCIETRCFALNEHSSSNTNTAI